MTEPEPTITKFGETSSSQLTDGMIFPMVARPFHLRVITHNIRYATSDLFTNERPWSERCPLVLNQLHHELRPVSLAPPTIAADRAVFVCLQEVLHNQLVDILAGLNGLSEHDSDVPADGPYWAHIGVGRDDGNRKGEYSPILYPIQLFKLLHQETVWLSPTPDRPSKGWDAGSIRLLTVGVFQHKLSPKRVIAANTHLDNVGLKSRFEGVAIILKTLKRLQSEWRTDGQIGVFLAGDFNSFPTQEAYKAVSDSGYLVDIHETVDVSDRYGDIITFTGFEPEKNKDEQGRIDFIWLGPASRNTSSGSTGLHSSPLVTPWRVDGYAVLPNLFDAGVYLSDHRAVVGDFTLE